MLILTRSLLQLRRKEEDLQLGTYASLPAPTGVLAYRRGERWVVALNLTDRPRRWPLPGEGRVAVSTHGGQPPSTRDVLELRPDEGVVLRLE